MRSSPSWGRGVAGAGAARRRPAAAGRSRQRGWVGLLVVLVALAIVGYLARDALKRYGLLGSVPAATRAAGPGERARAPGATGAADVSGAPVAPANAMERARGVEDMVQKAADERAGRVDRASP